jgi:chloramphenicol 3-O-phosphotransferase
MSASAALRRASASRIMKNAKLKERDRWIALWNYVLTNELEAGTLFLRTIPDSQIYAVLGDTHQVISLPRRGGDRWHAYFHVTYGFAEREKVSGFMYDALRSYAFTHGERVELRRFATYNQQTHTAYLSAYNGHLYKIEGSEQITEEALGTDNVFFADDDGGLNVEPDVGNHGLLLPRLTEPNFTASKMTAQQQRMALTIWLFAVAFPDLMPTKPILLLEGIKGSGKTSVVTMLQLVIQGAKRPISLRRDREDDFGVQLLRNPIALLDNQDSFIEWLPDAICAYATGAVWEKRKLYTDDESVIIKPQAFIAFTTRNPASFRRDDVIDRCVILRFDRRTTFKRMAKLEREILDDRARLLGEYLWYVGRIVDVLRTGDHESDADEMYRMADLVSFGRVVGQVLGWTPKDVNDLMQALQAERDAFLIEEDPLVVLINEWLMQQYNAVAAKRMGTTSNRGRLISVFDLAAELEAHADARGIAWKDNSRTIPQKLRMSHIEAEFRIEQHTWHNQKAYRIWRKTDPTLEVVEGG